jgi:2-aminoadipate transaminase
MNTTTASHRRLSARADSLTSSRIREILRVVEQPDVLSLAGGLPAPETFDVVAVRAALDHALSRRGRYGPVALQYGATDGIDSLRELIAARTGAPVDHVLVTTGAQQALDLVVRAPCDPGDVVVLQSPAYLGALQCIAAAGARAVPVRGDADGIDVDAIEALAVRGVPVRAVYVVPEFHNPTGAVLAADRRRALAALADRHGFVVVEDDPYRDLRFRGRAAPPAAHGELVARLGSASKIAAPGLRVGWLLAPPWLRDGVARLKQSADLHTSTLTQLVAESLLRAETEESRRARADRYRHKADVLADALVTHFGDRIAFERPDGGLFLWLRALDGTDTDALLTRAVEHGVAYVPGVAFAVPGAPDEHTSLRLSYASLDDAALREAASRLASTWGAAT